MCDRGSHSSANFFQVKTPAAVGSATYFKLHYRKFNLCNCLAHDYFTIPHHSNHSMPWQRRPRYYRPPRITASSNSNRTGASGGDGLRGIVPPSLLVCFFCSNRYKKVTKTKIIIVDPNSYHYHYNHACPSPVTHLSPTPTPTAVVAVETAPAAWRRGHVATSPTT